MSWDRGPESSRRAIALRQGAPRHEGGDWARGARLVALNPEIVIGGSLRDGFLRRREFPIGLAQCLEVVERGVAGRERHLADAGPGRGGAILLDLVVGGLGHR